MKNLEVPNKVSKGNLWREFWCLKGWNRTTVQNHTGLHLSLFIHHWNFKDNVSHLKMHVKFVLSTIRGALHAFRSWSMATRKVINVKEVYFIKIGIPLRIGISSLVEYLVIVPSTFICRNINFNELLRYLFKEILT